MAGRAELGERAEGRAGVEPVECHERGGGQTRRTDEDLGLSQDRRMPAFLLDPPGGLVRPAPERFEEREFACGLPLDEHPSPRRVGVAQHRSGIGGASAEEVDGAEVEVPQSVGVPGRGVERLEIRHGFGGQAVAHLHRLVVGTLHPETSEAEDRFEGLRECPLPRLFRAVPGTGDRSQRCDGAIVGRHVVGEQLEQHDPQGAE